MVSGRARSTAIPAAAQTPWHGAGRWVAAPYPAWVGGGARSRDSARLDESPESRANVHRDKSKDHVRRDSGESYAVVSFDDQVKCLLGERRERRVPAAEADHEAKAEPLWRAVAIYESGDDEADGKTAAEVDEERRGLTPPTASGSPRRPPRHSQPASARKPPGEVYEQVFPWPREPFWRTSARHPGVSEGSEPPRA